jgi:diguanylate cyclase (GGDEF)-like protein
MEEARRLNKRLEGARNAAEAEALTDALTGLGNRRAMEEALARLVAEGAPFGLINFDLDRFKAVNDTLGHAAGDAVLSAVAGALRAELRRGDLAARVGGDEFVAILPALDEPAQLAAIAGRIIARVEIPVPYGDTLCSVSASAGIAVSTHYTAPDPERLLQDADRALYASKHAGRGRATLFGAALAKPTPKRKREAVRG